MSTHDDFDKMIAFLNEGGAPERAVSPTWTMLSGCIPARPESELLHDYFDDEYDGNESSRPSSPLPETPPLSDIIDPMTPPAYMTSLPESCVSVPVSVSPATHVKPSRRSVYLLPALPSHPEEESSFTSFDDKTPMASPMITQATTPQRRKPSLGHIKSSPIPPPIQTQPQQQQQQGSRASLRRSFLQRWSPSTPNLLSPLYNLRNSSTASFLRSPSGSSNIFNPSTTMVDSMTSTPATSPTSSSFYSSTYSFKAFDAGEPHSPQSPIFSPYGHHPFSATTLHVVNDATPKRRFGRRSSKASTTAASATTTTASATETLGRAKVFVRKMATPWNRSSPVVAVPQSS